jgi:peptide/nickel transport system substrate-binding protein
MHTRWPLFTALVAGSAVLAIFGYVVLANPEGEAVPASGGRYVEGVMRPPERINPLFAAGNTTDADLSALIFSGLIRIAPDGTPLPDLAERWEITGNGQSYTFHLRRGVAWHDGEPFDAEDVAFTFDAISDPGFKGDPALAQLVQGVVVEARDPYTVEFTLEQTYAPFLAYLGVGILPEHLLSGLDANQLFNAPYNAQPVGTGPYRMERRTDTTVELVTNSTYYLGPPHIEELAIRVFRDASSVVAALRSDEIDGALLGEGITAADVEFLRDTGRYTVHELPSTAFFALYFDTRSPLFEDREVRRALLEGLDRAAVVRDVADGQGRPAGVGITEASWAHRSIEIPEFNAGHAASALERAGWQRASDGIRQNGGRRLAFSLAVGNDPTPVAIAEHVARQWAAIGIDVTVRPLQASTYLEEHVLPRDYEVALVLVDPGIDPDPYPFWHSSQIAPPGRNLSNYGESRIDDVLERARQTTDTARRIELYELFSNYLLAATPFIPVYSPVRLYLHSTEIQGFTPVLLYAPSSRFFSVSQWFVDTRVE